jgi:alkylation response protein AidB-like acyl-CoA dehydrogenase
MDFHLTDEQLHWQRVARDFAEQEIKPVACERERIVDPWQRYPWDLIEKADAVGLRTLALPKELGGGGADTLTLVLCVEELAVGDVGVAVDLDQTWKFTPIIAHLMNDAQRERFLPMFRDDPRCVLALGGTEPAAGSDTWGPYVARGAGAALAARREDDGWVLNGRKHFINNGGEARLVFILARTDPNATIVDGLTAFVAEQGRRGFGYGVSQDKVGQRLSSNVELIFEDCRVPDDNRLSGVGGGLGFLGYVGRRSLAKTGALSVGVARGAFEAALGRAEERIQGGVPIIQHQATQVAFGEMLAEIEAARSLVWRAAWSADSGEPFDPKLGNVAKLFATEMAVRVATRALQVWGGYGVMTQWAAEKFYRDAITVTHMDGANQLIAIRTGAQLSGESIGGWMG